MTSTEFAKEYPTLSYTRAWGLVREHDVTESEFLLAFGLKNSYNTQTILDWLGY
jgi:hypothetical protein